MKYFFDAALLPSEQRMEYDCSLVVDLLRASTQITAFFENGGTRLIPCMNEEDAVKVKERLSCGWKLMGERGGLMIPGFDFGNSPLEIIRLGSPSKAIMTTSNGTRAILGAAENCGNVLVACARNAEAVSWDAVCRSRRICVVAAGHQGRFSIEDTVCAGMLIEKMLKMAPSLGGTEMELSDSAIAAVALWHRLGPDLEAICLESEHGLNLRELGFTDDILFCAETDSTAVIPYLTTQEGYPILVSR